MATIKTNSKKPTFTAEFVKHDTEHAVFLGSPVVDDLMTAMIALSAETWSIRRRSWITELLMERNGAVTREMVENYQPTPDEMKQMDAERNEFVHRTFGHMNREGDDIIASSSFKPNSRK